MKPVPSTAEIVALKIANRGVDNLWVEWAYEMLKAGFENENLIILAGELPPYNQFELKELTDKIFDELKIDLTHEETIASNYTYYLIVKAIEGKKSIDTVLSTIYHICRPLDEPGAMNDFIHLYWAKDQLKYDEYQDYWPQGDRNTIDEVIRNYFIKWKEEYKDSFPY